MKLRLSYLAILSGVLMLHGCGGGGVLGKTPNDTDTMVPTAGTIDLSTLPHPPANAVTLTTDEHWIYDSAKKPVILRGANLLYGDSPATRINGITALKDQGSNMVRLLLTDKTTDVELEGALAKVIGQGMIAVVSLTTPVFDDASKNTLTCTENSAFLLNAIDTLWLGKWLPVLSEDKFQAGLMINVANGWGPVGIFNQDSFGYQEYIETYKAIIGKFRTVGFKVPMVIDAPSCGQDFNAFLSGRTRELQAADSAKNIVLGVHADGNKWSDSDKISNAATLLYNEKAPFILTGFTGSDVADIDQKPINHMDLIQKSSGDVALAFNLPWAGTNDSAAYAIALDKPLDLRGGAGVSANVFLDKLYSEFFKNDAGHYIPLGKLTVGMYLADSAGNRLLIGTTAAKDLRSNQWNRLSYTAPASAAEIKSENYLNGAASFDLMTVSKVGLVILANEKPMDIKAPVKFDDLAINPGVLPPVQTVVSNFDTDTNGWSDAGWGPVSVSSVGGALALLPGGDFAIESPGWKTQVNLSKINFKKTVFMNLRMFIPQSYAGDNLYMNVWGRFGASWEIQPSVNVNTSIWKKGEWNDIQVTLKWSESNDVSIAQDIGFQIGGFSLPKTEPILIDSITFLEQDAKRTKTVTALQYESKFTKGTEHYQQDWGRLATVTEVNGELNVTPKWVNDQGNPDDVVILKSDINSIPEINVSGPVTLKARVFIPASYAGSDLHFSIFTQDITWGHDMQFAGRDLTIADFTPGEWTSLSFTTDTFPAGFVRTQSLRNFGFRWWGVNGNTDTVKIDDVQLYGNTEVEDSTPLATIAFVNQAQIDAFKFDFASGTLTESALASAKYADWKIIPFGWAADSWTGQTGDKAPLNLSKQEGVADLTQRGEEIINSMFGIKATSVPVNFPAAVPK